LPFGTELDVYDDGYEFLAHSVAPKPEATTAPGVTVGGKQCSQPYEMALLNVSAMSFGSLSANAILALNAGARAGGFAHDTGEGGLTRYHLEHGGDLVWEIGSGYFGCRNRDGHFDSAPFREKVSHEAVRCVSLKLSQGAKPGHGGVMPAAKVTKEIADIRGVPAGEKCVSPAYHSAFSTPREMIRFLQTLRELSGGKPVGFKLCVGQPTEFLAICKAIRETSIFPDFVIVDGGEGGTGAAPIEFEDHVGMPLTEALIFVNNALVGAGLRRDIRVGCSGKIVSGFDIARRIAQGADYCNVARAMMFALGCIQAQRCHTNRCPVGVTTHDPKRTRALVVSDKAKRVERYQRNTIAGLGQIVAALGLEHPREILPDHLYRRVSPHEVKSYAELHVGLADGELLEGASDSLWRQWWDTADADRFGSNESRLAAR
jgi:glutamate synthase domain-containing protein 2